MASSYAKMESEREEEMQGCSTERNKTALQIDGKTEFHYFGAGELVGGGRGGEALARANKHSRRPPSPPPTHSRLPLLGLYLYTLNDY